MGFVRKQVNLSLVTFLMDLVVKPIEMESVKHNLTVK